MIVVILLIGMRVVFAQEYSFCSEDNLYSFTSQLCPGGVLLKEAIKIDEPCFCFGADLKIYEDCDAGGLMKAATFPGCQAPLIQPSDNWSGKAKFLLPTDNFTQKSVGEFEFCPKIRDTCVRLGHGNLVGINGLNEIPDDDMNVIRRNRDGPSCSISDLNCTDDKTLMISNAVEMLTYIQSKERLIKVSNLFRLLKISVEIFKALSPEWMVPDTTMDNIFDIFHIKFHHLDIIRSDRHLRDDTYLELKYKLEKCLTDTKELVFIQDKSTCPPKVGKLVHMNEEMGQSEALDGEMPADRMYKKDEEDLVIGVLWKVVDAVHKKCFLYNHYYFTNMEDIFLNPLVQAKHYDTSGYATLLYTGIVDHDNLEIFMQNVDKIDAAVHATAKDKNYFKKPKRDEGSAPSSRRKRSADDSYLEIWGGRAYCFLQKKNFSIPMDHPELKKKCEETKMAKNIHCVPFPLKEDTLKNISTNCPQGEGFANKSGIFRLTNNVVESCCYDPMNCTETDQNKCMDQCKEFCSVMKSQYLSSDNLTCKCAHSQEFVNFTLTLPSSTEIPALTN